MRVRLGGSRYSSGVLLRAKSRPSVGCALHAAAAAALGNVAAAMNRALILWESIKTCFAGNTLTEMLAPRFGEFFVYPVCFDRRKSYVSYRKTKKGVKSAP